MRRAAAWAGFTIGLAALILQFVLTIQLRLTSGDSVLGAVVFFFTFFTIVTNTALVGIYASELWPRGALGWFRRPVTRGMMAAVMILVCAFYHFVLAATWNPQGLNLVADVTLHYVAPVLYVVWWALFARHGMLRPRDVPTMLVPPLIYFVYAMLRGGLVNEYPYPILEANRLGYTQVAINVAFVLAGLVVLCLIVVALDRVLTRLRLPGTR